MPCWQQELPDHARNLCVVLQLAVGIVPVRLRSWLRLPPEAGLVVGMQEQRDRRPRPPPPHCSRRKRQCRCSVNIVAAAMPAPASQPHISLSRAVNTFSRPMGPQPRTCIGKMPGGCPVDRLIIVAPSLPRPLCLHCRRAMVVKYTGGISRNHTNNATRQRDDGSARHRATTRHETTSRSERG